MRYITRLPANEHRGFKLRCDCCGATALDNDFDNLRANLTKTEGELGNIKMMLIELGMLFSDPPDLCVSEKEGYAVAQKLFHDVIEVYEYAI